MSSLDVRAFEKRLRDRYAEVWADIQQELEKYRGQQFQDLINQNADPDDVAVADLLIDLNIAEISRDVGELRDIQQALEHINKGTYGTCIDCGEPIAVARLQAAPEALRCVDCQTRAEKWRRESPTL